VWNLDRFLELREKQLINFLTIGDRDFCQDVLDFMLVACMSKPLGDLVLMGGGDVVGTFTTLPTGGKPLNLPLFVRVASKLWFSLPFQKIQSK